MSSRQQLSQNFYLDEFLRSETAARCGIDMSISDNGIIQTHLFLLANSVLQPLRDHFGVPVTIISGYRPAALNRKVKGAKDSAHLYGYAADIRVAGKTPLEVAEWIADNIKDFDQVINEFDSWVHVAIKINPLHGEPRKQCLTAIKVKRFLKSKTDYVHLLWTTELAHKFYLKGKLRAF
ncbi:MAG: hypothetical protein JKY50_09440 [Oleispira sp.]|nr:hypothetical protein [Oleispira sp.]